MPGIVRQGDYTSGHDGYPPTLPSDFSPDVFVNGCPVVIENVDIITHCNPDDCHSGTYVGSHEVYANGRRILVQGDNITCGDTCNECSSDVFIGG